MEDFTLNISEHQEGSGLAVPVAQLIEVRLVGILKLGLLCEKSLRSLEISGGSQM